MLYRTSPQVSRLDNPVSLQVIVDFNTSNSKIKHAQSENGIKSLFNKSELHTAITFIICNQFWIAMYQNLS